jgi:hypothetical protein
LLSILHTTLNSNTRVFSYMGWNGTGSDWAIATRGRVQLVFYKNKVINHINFKRSSFYVFTFQQSCHITI